MNIDPTRVPSFAHSLVVFVGVLALIGVGLFGYAISVHMVLFGCIIWVALHARMLGVGFMAIRSMMSSGIASALPAIYIFVLIGMVIASFMVSGTIASLIVYGLDWLSPGTFLLSGFFLASLMSVATGTSWGTVGTIGVVLMGIGASLGVSLPLVAGAVISGATFGDKLSPISDTTNLAAMSAGTDLYTHIGGMLYTTVPTFLIAAVLFGVLDTPASGGWESGRPGEIQAALGASYQVGIGIALAPLMVMLALSVLRFPAEVTMTASVLFACAIAVIVQDRSIVDVLNALWQNTPGTTGNVELDALLGRGGVVSMSWTLLLALFALALGGVLKDVGFLESLVAGVIARIRRTATLVAATIVSGAVGNGSLGEAYVSIVLNSQLYKGAYERQGLQPAMLSRTVEEGATLTTGLIPWTTAGAFYAVTLGVATLDYAPWAFFNYLNGAVAVVMAALGVGLLKSTEVRATAHHE